MEGHDRPAGAPTVEGWDVRRRLGAGVDAEVWEVRGPAGESAALKVPLPGGADGLAQEAAALRHHRHRHLVAPLGEVETDRGTGLLTELLAGGSLAALVRAGGPLPAARMRTATVPIAQALESLHAAGIVHGDVSPSNILFDVDGRPALADLGASRLVGGTDRDGCTPGFAAPEVLAEAGAASAASDVFSLAACAWFCLTGRAPASLADRAPLPVLVPEAAAELGDLLDAGLEPDPDRRPGAGEFAHALYATGECAPVLLHASASPELALVLPTVRPDRAEADGGVGLPGRRGAGRSRGSAGSPGRGLGKGRGSTSAGAGVRRPVLVGAGVLAAAAAVAGAALLVSEDTVGEASPPAGGASVGSAASTTPAPEGAETPEDPGGPAPGRGSTPTAAEGAPTASGRSTAAAGARPTGSEAPRAGSSRQTPEEPQTPQLPDGAVLERVAVERAGALVSADADAVDAYAVPGSEAAEADRAVIDRLRSGGDRFEDLTLRVVPDGQPDGVPDATEGPQEAAGAVPSVVAVPVLLETSAHRLVGRDGTVRAEEPARSDPAVLVMERTDGRWKVSAVRTR